MESMLLQGTQKKKPNVLQIGPYVQNGTYIYQNKLIH